MPLSGYTDPTCFRYDIKANGAANHGRGSAPDDRKTPGGDSRYLSAEHTDFRFSGESEEDFEKLYRFVNEMEFDRLGVFAYSQEEDTPAALMPDQVPEETREKRRDELMELQQEIAFEKAAEMEGRILEAAVEGYLPEEGVYVARTYMDAPNVDGYLF